MEMFILGFIVISIGFVALNIVEDKKKVERIKNMTHEQKVLEVAKLSKELDKYNTSHLLHLVLSFFTLGGWLFVWALVSVSNSDGRRRVESLMKEI